MISERFRNDNQPLLKLNNVQLTAKNELEKKIQTGKYKFERISCPVCSSNETELLAEKDRYGLENQVVACSKCGLIYTNPRMTQESYNEFYDNEYRKLYVGTDLVKESFFKKQYNRAGKILSFIHATFPEKDFEGLNVLEVGCGAGGILYYFKEQGFNVKGVDLGSEYLQYGKRVYNLDLTHGSLKDVPKDFIPDIIIYSHVFEHILDLNAEIYFLKKMCHEKTIIYVEVPGIKNIHKAYEMDSLLYFQNAHTFHFSLSSLTNLFVKNGFKRIEGNEYVRSVFSKDPDWVKQEIKIEYPDIVNYLKNTEQNRGLFLFKILMLIKKIVFVIVSFLKRFNLSKPSKVG